MADSRFNPRGSSILIVDDVPANLGVLILILENAGYQVQVATSGENGLEIAARSLPDLILLDVMMPGIDGFETCRRLKNEDATREIPVIFLTALGEAANVVEGFRAGSVDYMTKPFRQEEVLIRVQAHLERAWLARELAEKNREMAQLNALLEQQVETRTRELQSKARELEGRDRISQQLLTVHSLHETLNVILEGITGVVDLNRAAIYLEEHGEFNPAAAIGVFEPGISVDQDQLDRLTPSPAFREMANEVRDHRRAVSTDASDETGDSNVVLIPILWDEYVLGLIEVAAPGPVEAGALQTLSGFALQTAVAISDARAQDDATRKAQIEEALKSDDALENENPVS